MIPSCGNQGQVYFTKSKNLNKSTLLPFLPVSLKPLLIVLCRFDAGLILVPFRGRNLPSTPTQQAPATIGGIFLSL